MKKRNEPRHDKKLIVNIEDSGNDELGLTRNLSKEGMCIDSQAELQPHKEIVISLAVPGEVFTLKGEVMWCRASEDKNSEVPEAIGIRLTEAPEEYINYIEYLKHKH